MLTERRGGPLPAHRAASRLSAYVYGNILVLAAVVVASGESIYDGHAGLIVVGTGVTTYIAHVFADLLARANIPEAHRADDHHGRHAGDDAHRQAARREVFEELRDAVPIASSAIWPAIVLVLGYHGLIPTDAAQLIAGGIIVLRIASIQIVTERVRGNRLDLGMVIAGLVAAGLAGVIVVLKTFLGY
ncbi:hypothetical protein ACLQ3C_19680 [Gordonia sp. DT30]|uniref:hypothetical protein n=1 Tax=Gordonia sp. DT30 TaxID=3416546 RepID=UPI003CF7E1A1